MIRISGFTGRGSYHSPMAYFSSSLSISSRSISTARTTGTTNRETSRGFQPQFTHFQSSHYELSVRLVQPSSRSVEPFVVLTHFCTTFVIILRTNSTTRQTTSTVRTTIRRPILSHFLHFFMCRFRKSFSCKNKQKHIIST